MIQLHRPVPPWIAIASIFSITALPVIAQTSVFKCTDDQGNVEYSDQQCDISAETIPLHIPSINTDSEATKPAPLQVKSWTCVADGAWMYVRGEVVNRSDAALEKVLAVGVFRDTFGNLLKTSEAFITLSPLQPGRSSPFEVGVRKTSRMTTCSLSFKELRGTPIPASMF